MAPGTGAGHPLSWVSRWQHQPAPLLRGATGTHRRRRQPARGGQVGVLETRACAPRAAGFEANVHISACWSRRRAGAGHPVTGARPGVGTGWWVTKAVTCAFHLLRTCCLPSVVWGQADPASKRSKKGSTFTCPAAGASPGHLPHAGPAPAVPLSETPPPSCLATSLYLACPACGSHGGHCPFLLERRLAHPLLCMSASSPALPELRAPGAGAVSGRQQGPCTAALARSLALSGLGVWGEGSSERTPRAVNGAIPFQWVPPRAGSPEPRPAPQGEASTPTDGPRAPTATASLSALGRCPFSGIPQHSYRKLLDVLVIYFLHSPCSGACDF